MKPETRKEDVKMTLEEFIRKQKKLNDLKNFNIDLNCAYLTAAQYAEKMQVCVTTVQRKIRTGEIAAVKVGRNWRIPVKMNLE